MTTIIDTIKALTFARLKNGAHDNFAQYTLVAINRFQIISRRFAHCVALFRKAAEKEHNAYLRTQQKFVTAQLNDVDADRIKSLRMLRDIAKAATLSPNPTMRVVAEKLLLAIDAYGGPKIQNQSVEERSGNISNLVDDLHDQLQEEVDVLSLDNVVATLQETNDRYIRLYDERNLQDAEYGVGTIAELRVETDRCMRLLFSMVNNAAKSGYYAELKGFIDYMNVEINRLRTLVGQGASHTSTPSVGGNEEWPDDEDWFPDEDEPETPPATEPDEPETPPATEPETPDEPGSGEEQQTVKVTWIGKDGQVKKEAEYPVGTSLTSRDYPETSGSGWTWRPGYTSQETQNLQHDLTIQESYSGSGFD